MRLTRFPAFEPGGREFESLWARQILLQIQRVVAIAAAAFCFSKTNVGILRKFSALALLADSMRFANSAPE